eukprot:TRINITY_DN12925_c0_g2_i1.p1 TRINITY_DN12925_c0_g2~~TRINITY_DN12925_c0_g2_i1.p1  ORF type:complete len:351 (+),score=55.23 TRINITY_DN12925_c0_g2_i1:64-1116(+)
MCIRDRRRVHGEIQSKFLREYNCAPMKEVRAVSSMMQMLSGQPLRFIPKTDLESQCSVAMIFRFQENLRGSITCPKLEAARLSTQNAAQMAKVSQELLSSCMLDRINAAPSSAFEVLFTQRTKNPRDRHAGQISFPGGHCEKGETDLCSAIRETAEEVNYDLANPSQFLFLGSSSKNFFAYFKRERRTMVRLHYFLQRPDFTAEPIGSPSEVSEVHWVRLRDLMSPDQYKTVTAKSTSMVNLFPKNSLKGALVRTLLSKTDHKCQYQGFPIGKDETVMYGFTLQLTMHFLNELKKANIGLDNLTDDELSQLDSIVNKGTHVAFNFDSFPILLNRMFVTLYDQHRLRQFRA